MAAQQSATMSLGGEDFAASGRVLHWAAVGAVGGALMIAMTTMGVWEPGRNAGGDLFLTAGLLLLAVALLGMMLALRSGREVRFGPDGTVAIHRHLLPPRRYVDIGQIVLHERSWRLAVPVVTGLQPASDQGHGPDAIAPDLGAASLSVVLADGRDIALGEIEWEHRDAIAQRAARIVGADLMVRRSSAVASCG